MLKDDCIDMLRSQQLVVSSCEYRTSSFIFKGAKYLQNPLFFTAKKPRLFLLLTSHHKDFRL